MKNFHLSVISFHTYLCELLRHKLLVFHDSQHVNLLCNCLLLITNKKLTSFKVQNWCGRKTSFLSCYWTLCYTRVPFSYWQVTYVPVILSPPSNCKKRLSTSSACTIASSMRSNANVPSVPNWAAMWNEYPRL